MDEKLRRIINYDEQLGLRVNLGKSKPGSFQPLRVGEDDIEDLKCSLRCIIAKSDGAEFSSKTRS